MKITHNKKAGFEPIELRITIESEDELADFYARLNASNNTCIANQHDKLPYKGHKSKILFNIIDGIIENLKQ